MTSATSDRYGSMSFLPGSTLNLANVSVVNSPTVKSSIRQSPDQTAVLSNTTFLPNASVTMNSNVIQGDSTITQTLSSVYNTLKNTKFVPGSTLDVSGSTLSLGDASLSVNGLSAQELQLRDDTTSSAQSSICRTFTVASSGTAICNIIVNFTDFWSLGIKCFGMTSTQFQESKFSVASNELTIEKAGYSTDIVNFPPPSISFTGQTSTSKTVVMTQTAGSEQTTWFVRVTGTAFNDQSSFNVAFV